jgi:dimethylargininase
VYFLLLCTRSSLSGTLKVPVPTRIILPEQRFFFAEFSIFIFLYYTAKILMMTTMISVAARKAIRRQQHARWYTMAICRSVAPSLVDALSMSPEKLDICYDVANQQHDHYIQTLRKSVPTLLLPFLPDHPDCCFVEDTMVAVGNTAVMTQPGHASRRGEVNSIRRVCLELGMDIVDMSDKSPMATCDGGDVMYTGQHLFVGISERTNMEGVKVLSESFRGVGVIVVMMPKGKGALHLKSVVSQLDEETLLVPVGPIGDAIINQLGNAYQVVRLPSMLACNVVAVNGVVLAQDGGCSTSREILEKTCSAKAIILKWLNVAELAKCDGALTCCSVLLNI